MEALTPSEIGLFYAEGLFTDDEIRAMLERAAAVREVHQ